MKKTLILIMAILVIVAGITTTIINIYLYMQIPKEPHIPFSEITVIKNNNKKITSMTVADYEKVSVNVTDDIVFLTSECMQLLIVTNTIQTDSIKSGLNGIVEFRPSTHDIMKDILDNFGIKVRMLKIEKLERGAYFAKLMMQKDDKILILDSRPSDGIAIVVRTNAPIYVNTTLMKTQGINIC